jgi:hypothetical protein
VWFSQNARGYTAILFFTLLTSHLLLRLVEDEPAAPGRLAWGYGALMALAAYTHLTAALVAVGHALALLLVAPGFARSGRLRRLGWPAAAIALSALLTLCLYALIIPQLIAVLLEPTMEGVTVEWTSPRWLVTETLRVLGAGVPGGILTVIGGLAVLGIGARSYWRQSRVTVLVMLCPVLVTVSVVLAMRHNLWPRFFFFAASFVVLMALRGGFVISHWIFRALGDRVAIAGAAGVAALSALTVPRAWLPKQQFQAAVAYIESQRQPGDAVVALDVATYVYLLYRTPRDWALTSSLSTLEAIERAAPRTWVVYTFPTRLRALFPEMARHVAAPPYRQARVLPAGVGGGEIHVQLRESN